MGDKNLYTVEKFTGRMINEADAADIHPGDAELLVNLSLEQGKLKLDRTKSEAKVLTSLALTQSADGNSINSWFTPSGNMVVAYGYLNSSYYFGAHYDTTTAFGNTITPVAVGGTIDPLHSNNSYVPYRDMLRIGIDDLRKPVVFKEFDASNTRFAGNDTSVQGLLMFADSNETEGRGIYPVIVATDGITASKALKAMKRTTLCITASLQCMTIIKNPT
jgi:hypothetical protein